MTALAQMRDMATFERGVQRQTQQGVEILSNVRQSVKIRQQRMEDEARQAEIFVYGRKIERPEIAGEVEAKRQELLATVNQWTQADKKAILALDPGEVNRVINEATAVGYYHGLDVVRYTKLYELGKDVIAGSLFELPENTHPDSESTYSRIIRNVQNNQTDSTTLEQTLQGYFDSFFGGAAAREEEIAEFFAKKQDYRVLLFKRVTLAYLRALLASGEVLPDCDVPAKTLRYSMVGGKKYPVMGCPDPALDHLRRYVNAIRELQAAEQQTFLSEARGLIAEQQLVVDFASVVPLLGDAMDWTALTYAVYAQEDFSGHCISYLDYVVLFVAAALPLAGPAMINRAIERSPRLAGFMVNLANFIEAINNINLRTASRSTVANAAGANVGLMGQLGAMFGKDDNWALQASERIFAWLKRVEDAEQEAAKKAAREARELAERTARQRAARIMEDTVNDARSQIAALKQLQQEAPEVFEMALKHADETLKANLLATAANSSMGARQAVAGANMGEGHVDALLYYLRRVERGTVEGLDPQKMVLIYRAVNPDAKRLIDMGFFTKAMDIKGKSADWGVHRGFIPIDQSFSKLANPNKKVLGELSPADRQKVEAFQEKVTDFFAQKGSESDKYKTALVINGMPVKVVSDVKTGQKMTALFDPKTGHYLDEAGQVIPSSAIDTRHATNLEVMAVPDENGIPQALTADYDLLAFGFTSEIETPAFNDLTGYISEKQKKVLAGTNKAVRDATGYMGDVSHHGPEVQFPFSPGALEEDPRVFALDLDLGPVEIPRCDAACMAKWCRTTGHCAKWGFPATPVCNMQAPVSPCIPVDPNRLLKDYMHHRRLQGYNLFPNDAWGWGDYNVMGGWTMTTYLRTPLTLDSAYNVTMDSLLKGVGKAVSCPFGKRASDFIEEADEREFGGPSSGEEFKENDLDGIQFEGDQ